MIAHERKKTAHTTPLTPKSYQVRVMKISQNHLFTSSKAHQSVYFEFPTAPKFFLIRHQNFQHIFRKMIVDSYLVAVVNITDCPIRIILHNIVR
ncbi:MAG: hypothetical protein LBE91_20650, partial [Tannerella sp.]|nr:hypothetical protein [Tannerella sp.]